MAQYCDSKRLERLWFEWAMTATVPSLEFLRYSGVVYSRVSPCQIVTHGAQTCNNPWLPLKEHYLSLETPLFVASVGGLVNIDLDLIEVGKNTVTIETHNKLLADGFILEKTYDESWHVLCLEVKKLCEGISRKFSTDAEYRFDIDHEAFMMIIHKIKNLKLKFLPGKAPVFNFLTTAIYRCIYNYLRKCTKYKQQMSTLQHKMATGNLDTSMRSYKTVAEN